MDDTQHDKPTFEERTQAALERLASDPAAADAYRQEAAVLAQVDTADQEY